MFLFNVLPFVDADVRVLTFVMHVPQTINTATVKLRTVYNVS